jgi:hypothetical protein
VDLRCAEGSNCPVGEFGWRKASSSWFLWRPTCREKGKKKKKKRYEEEKVESWSVDGCGSAEKGEVGLG